MKVITTTTAEGVAFDKAVSELNDNNVGKVGWFENSKYDDKYATPVALVAAVQEYGYSKNNIPARPFIEPTIQTKQNEWLTIMGKGVDAVLSGKKTINAVLDLVGQKARFDIQKAITQVFSPPLKPSTIRARLNRKSNKNHVGALDKPLIDTGIMYGTITNVVEPE